MNSRYSPALLRELSQEADEEAPLSLQPPIASHFEVISRFPRYGQSVASLPPIERVKIERIARFVAHGLRSGEGAIRSIHIVGHADLDTPRRPAFEHQVALARARNVLDALWRALDGVDRSAGTATPLYSSRVAWEVHSEGATRLVVQNPRTDSDRSRNRRVEISLLPYHNPTVPPAPTGSARFGLTPLARIDVGAGTAIEDFLRRAPNDTLHFKDKNGEVLPDRRVCVAAAMNKSIQLCNSANVSDQDAPCRSPVVRGRCFVPRQGALGIDILAGKDYRSPLKAPITCCGVQTPCPPTTLSKMPPGQYLVLQYNSQPLAKMVDNLKCLLRRGCTVPVGVLSGICDDMPDSTCGAPLATKWRDCWEHWLLVIGHDGDRFVFWDSAQSSVMGPLRRDKDDHWFGFLYYDSNNNRFSTATTNPGVPDPLEVDWHGYHTQGFPRIYAQKRYQVVSMWPGLPWKADSGPCSK